MSSHLWLIMALLLLPPLQTCANQKLLDQFTEANKLLEAVQKGLADYLETKRLAFARFFFLSNDELLQVGAGGRLLDETRLHLLLDFAAPGSGQVVQHATHRLVVAFSWQR
jgi:hypothetical protein